MNLTDRDIFALIDDLNIDEFEEIMEHTSMNHIVVDDITKKRIEAEVLRKIDNTCDKAKNKKTMKNKIIAASVASVLILSSFQLLPSTVLAEIRARLQFIPGIGKVVEKEGEETLYILDKSIKAPYKGGEISVKSIIRNGENIELVLSGERTEKLLGQDIKIKGDNGAVYETKTYSVGSGGDNWEGYYSYQGNLGNDNSLSLVIEEKIKIPVKLIEAKSFEDYSNMGGTDRKNGVLITAVTSAENGLIKINLVYPPMEGKEINGFGESYRNNKIFYDIEVKDDKDEIYELNHPSSYSGVLSEFTFKENKDVAYYKLKIPFIYLQYEDKVKVKVSIPSEGKLQANQEFTIAGFKGEITELERIDGDTLRVYINSFYDKNKTESLKRVSLDGANLPASGYMTQFNEEGNIHYFEFKIKPNMKNITLRFIEAETELQGPWELKIQNTID